MKTIGVAVFCLLLGFAIGFNFTSPVAVDDNWVDLEEQGLMKIQINLDRCLKSLRGENYSDASVYASDAFDHCKSLRYDLYSYKRRHRFMAPP